MDQNAVLNIWCREIVEHQNAQVKGMSSEAIGIYRIQHGERPKLTSAKLIKGLVKYCLGNVFEAKHSTLTGPVVMSTRDYKMTEAELTETDRKHGFIPMDEFMGKIQAWAATDLGLELKVEGKE